MQIVLLLAEFSGLNDFNLFYDENYRQLKNQKDMSVKIHIMYISLKKMLYFQRRKTTELDSLDEWWKNCD